jgi:hypothetical protein
MISGADGRRTGTGFLKRLAVALQKRHSPIRDPAALRICTSARPVVIEIQDWIIEQMHSDIADRSALSPFAAHGK